MSDQEPLQIEIRLRDPDLGETVRETVTYMPHGGEMKAACFQEMLEDANGRILGEVDELYEEGRDVTDVAFDGQRVSKGRRRRGG